jgi:hypothetical protein
MTKIPNPIDQRKTKELRMRNAVWGGVTLTGDSRTPGYHKEVPMLWCIVSSNQNDTLEKMLKRADDS